MKQIPSPSDFSRANVNVRGQANVQPYWLFDTLTYTSASTTSLQFFKEPIGQSSKTELDTNMSNAGLLPAGKSFLCEGIGFMILPGDSVMEGAIASANAGAFINDVYTMMFDNYVEFYIGTRNYVPGGSLINYPPRHRIGGFAALSDATTAAASLLTQAGYATPCGHEFRFNGTIAVPSGQNFSVNVKFPTALTMPSGNNLKVKCFLYGYQKTTVQ